MTSNGLNTTQLAIYSTLSIPISYILIRHGRSGLLGWAYLFVFCTLRLAGAAIQMHADKNGTVSASAAIISNIGLSPLLLATSGILYEAWHYRNPELHTRLEQILMVYHHILVTTGIGFICAGASAFEKVNPKPSALNFVKIGIVILLLSWALICFWTAIAFRHTRQAKNALGYAEGTKILYAVLITLLFTGIRTLYTAIAILTGWANINPVTGYLGLRVTLSFVPELGSALVFVVIGLLTFDVQNTARAIGLNEDIEC